MTATHTYVWVPKKIVKDQAPPWWELVIPGKKTAWMKCPNGHLATLHDHEIDADGIVQPSVECPDDNCDFHSYIRLEDWEP